MKRLLMLACLVAVTLGGCVVLPVERPAHDHYFRDHRGYGSYGWHPGEPYHERRNAGYRR